MVFKVFMLLNKRFKWGYWIMSELYLFILLLNIKYRRHACLFETCLIKYFKLWCRMTLSFELQAMFICPVVSIKDICDFLCCEEPFLSLWIWTTPAWPPHIPAYSRLTSTLQSSYRRSCIIQAEQRTSISVFYCSNKISYKNKRNSKTFHTLHVIASDRQSMYRTLYIHHRGWVGEV